MDGVGEDVVGDAVHLHTAVVAAVLAVGVAVAGLRVAGLVGLLPDVDEADGRVESVEEAEGQGAVAQQGPGDLAVVVLLVSLGLVGLDLERLQDPHTDVADDEERHQFPAWFLASVCSRVAAASQPFYYHRGLDHDLNDLKTVKKDINISVSYSNEKFSSSYHVDPGNF